MRTPDEYEVGYAADVQVVEQLEAEKVVDRTGFQMARAEAALVEAITTSVLQAISTVVVDPPNLAPILSALKNIGTREQLAQVFEGFNHDFSLLLHELRQDLAKLRQEVLENRKETRSDAEVLLGEFRAMPQAIADIRQCLRRLEQKADHSEVLHAVRKLRVEPDYMAMADAVHERRVKVDNSELLQALRRLEPDHHATASVVAEKLRKVNLSMDTGELLAAIKRIKVDHREIANCVHERINRGSGLTVDQSEVIKELQRFKREVDPAPVLAAVQDLQEVDLSPILHAINNLKLQVDHTPVINEIQKIKVPSHDDIATQVHNRILRHTFTTDNSEVLSAINRMDVKPDLSPIIEAIDSSEIDLAPLHEAIRKINVKVDHGEVLQSIRKIQIPDPSVIAHTVHERFRKNSVSLDHGELIKEIRKSRREPDMSPVLAAISQAEVDFKPVIEEIKKLNVTVDNTQVLQVLSGLRTELLTAMSQPRELLQQTAPPFVQMQPPQPLQQVLPPPPLQQVHLQQQLAAEPGSPIAPIWRRRDVTPPPHGPSRQATPLSMPTGISTPSIYSSSVLAPPVLAGASDVVVEGFESPRSTLAPGVNRLRTPTSLSPARERRGVLPRGLLSGT